MWIYNFLTWFYFSWLTAYLYLAATWWIVCHFYGTCFAAPSLCGPAEPELTRNFHLKNMTYRALVFVHKISVSLCSHKLLSSFASIQERSWWRLWSLTRALGVAAPAPLSLCISLLPPILFFHLLPEVNPNPLQISMILCFPSSFYAIFPIEVG